MSKIGQEYLRLQEFGLLPDLETHPPSQNAYCEDGEQWLERQREADLEHQTSKEDD